MHTIIRLLTVIVTALPILANAGDENMHPVTWEEVKAEIGSYICVEAVALPSGETHYSFNLAEEEKCSESQAEPRLADAVASTLEQARPLLIGIQPKDVGYSSRKDMSPEERNAELHRACFSSEVFLRPIFNRLDSMLTSQGLKCDDCPIFEPRAVRTVSWEEFKNYLAAYAWPKESIPKDEDGNPTGETHYQLYVCIGINGIGEMENPDPYLASVAYTTAINSEQFFELAYKHFTDVGNSDAFQQMTDDQPRLQYLREHISANLADDDQLIQAVCPTLDRYYSDFRIQLDSCTEDSE